MPKTRRPVRALTCGNVRVVRNDAGTELWLYDEVGPWGTTASDVAKALGAVRGERVTLRVNSPGGDVFDGVAIYNLLRGHPGGVDVVVDGLAASAASFIAMAGETVTMAPHTRMMIHDAIGFAYGNAADMRELADLLDDVSTNIASIYADRSGGSVEDFRALMLAETWLSPEEALDLGLIDSTGEEDVEDAEGDEEPDGDEDGGESTSGDEPDGDEPAGPPVPGEDDPEDEDDDEVEAKLVAQWRESFAFAASRANRRRLTEGTPKTGRDLRPAARIHRPAARPAAKSPAVAADDIRTIMRGALAR